MESIMSGNPKENLDDTPPLTTAGIPEYKQNVEFFYEEVNAQNPYTKAMRFCSTTEVKIPKDEFNHDTEVRMLIHTPEGCKEILESPCIINAHGGGGIGGSPELEEPFCSFIAHENNVVVFNIDYRLAGSGAKVNQAAMDVVTAIKHIRKNAEKYLIDPDKICLYGFQGGGYIMSAACTLLAM